MPDPERNWARNLTYSAPVAHPATLEELQEVVAGADRVKALGTRHSFSPCADSPGLIVALDRIASDLVVDRDAGTATVGGQIRVGDLGRLLADEGMALANLPSLPHISLAGAVATATHGSGDGNGSLSAFVQALEVVGADGALRTVDDPDEVRGSVVALGALGVVTRLTVAIEPAFDVRQDPFDDVPWSAVEDSLDDVFATAYSVSLFPKWSAPTIQGALVKSRLPEPVESFFGATPAPRDPAEIGAETRTTAIRDVGPSWDRLPHFRLAAVPSVGEELQSEYAVPRATAPAAIAALRELGEQIDPALHVTEIRSVAADEDWLSPAYGTGTLAIGFTWKDLPDLVLPLLPRIEERLLPLGARPHWGKLFAANALRLRDHYPRWQDFAALRDVADPDRKFANAFLDEKIGR